MVTLSRTRQLADGRIIPLLALGVWQIPDGEACYEAVRSALDYGYRHIDTAQGYQNEQSVGRALRDSGVAREEVWVTTKFFPGAGDPVREMEQSLQRLGLDFVDLYLVHWPEGGPVRAWPGMERSQELTYARSIGVSNFSAADLRTVAHSSEVAPAVDQVQFSPFEFRRGLLEAAEELGVVLEAYSPLGTGRHLDDSVVVSIAERLGRTPAQILLRWCVQQQVPVVSKSTHPERIRQNAAIFDFELDKADVRALDDLDRTAGTSLARERTWW